MPDSEIGHLRTCCYPASRTLRDRGYSLGLSGREGFQCPTLFCHLLFPVSSLSLPWRCYNIYNISKKISKKCAQLFVSRQIKCKVIVMQIKIKEFHELFINSIINCMFNFLSYVYYLHSGVHDFTKQLVLWLLELKDKPVVVMRAETDMSRNLPVLSLSRYSVVKWCGLLSLTQCPFKLFTSCFLFVFTQYI